MLARLDNEVFFKKAFTDKIVFKAFVKDIVGIEVNPEKIETEKAFEPKTGSINFKYDIFAEDIEKRVVIEIQRVEYDHNFDRFLHYHLQAITEQQRTSANYSVNRTVYTIVVMTAPYKINKKTHEIYQDEVLISNLNPKNLKGVERRIYNHEIIFLNPNYKEDATPQNYRDWLDLIYESIYNPKSPNINLNNEGIKRAAEIGTMEKLTPEEWEQSKFEVMRREVIAIERDEERTETMQEVAEKMINAGSEDTFIRQITGLEIAEIQRLREGINKEK